MRKFTFVLFVYLTSKDIEYLHTPIHSALPQQLLGTVLLPSGEGVKKQQHTKYFMQLTVHYQWCTLQIASMLSNALQHEVHYHIAI